MGKGFDLGAMLKGVSNLDTGREQIEYIRLDLIDSDPNNFYQLSGIKELADNIATCGLQQPIRVRSHPDAEGRYMIVSGHRRRAALEALAQEEPERWQEVACIMESDAVSPALQQLRLIYGNSNTRALTPAEISEQAVQVEKLLYQLKEEGHEFPGRMRDHVAQVVQVSKSKLARLKVIRDGLDKCWQKSFKKGTIKESAAYALAQLPKELQKAIFDAHKGSTGTVYLAESTVKDYAKFIRSIDRLKCSIDGAPCCNRERKKQHYLESSYSWKTPCTSCCRDCDALATCKHVCKNLSGEIKQLKDDIRQRNKQTRDEKKERERPQIEQIQNLWYRFGYLRDKAGKTVKEVCDAADISYHKDDDKKYAALEDGTAKISTTTKLPYYYSCYLSDISRLIAIADLFGCSIDYLLCRTDYPELVKAAPEEKVSNPGTGWQTGEPEKIGFYAVVSLYDDSSIPDLHKMMWTGCGWKVGSYAYDPETDGKILGWMPMPKEGSDK